MTKQNKTIYCTSLIHYFNRSLLKYLSVIDLDAIGHVQQQTQHNTTQVITNNSVDKNAVHHTSLVYDARTQRTTANNKKRTVYARNLITLEDVHNRRQYHKIINKVYHGSFNKTMAIYKGLLFRPHKVNTNGNNIITIESITPYDIIQKESYSLLNVFNKNKAINEHIELLEKLQANTTKTWYIELYRIRTLTIKLINRNVTIYNSMKATATTEFLHVYTSEYDMFINSDVFFTKYLNYKKHVKLLDVPAKNCSHGIEYLIKYAINSKLKFLADHNKNYVYYQHLRNIVFLPLDKINDEFLIDIIATLYVTIIELLNRRDQIGYHTNNLVRIVQKAVEPLFTNTSETLFNEYIDNCIMNNQKAINNLLIDKGEHIENSDNISLDNLKDLISNNYIKGRVKKAIFNYNDNNIITITNDNDDDDEQQQTKIVMCGNAYCIKYLMQACENFINSQKSVSTEAQRLADKYIQAHKDVKGLEGIADTIKNMLNEQLYNINNCADVKQIYDINSHSYKYVSSYDISINNERNILYNRMINNIDSKLSKTQQQLFHLMLDSYRDNMYYIKQLVAKNTMKKYNIKKDQLTNVQLADILNTTERTIDYHKKAIQEVFKKEYPTAYKHYQKAVEREHQYKAKKDSIKRAKKHNK